MKYIGSIVFLLVLNNIGFCQLYTPSEGLSKVHFVIKNFGAKTGGDFSGLKGSIAFDPKDLGSARFKVSVNAASINTDNKTRDKHLRKEDYFNVEKFPLISFESTKITATSLAGRYFVTGNLTIKDITKIVRFGFTATPSDEGYSFKGAFEINRRDYGVGGNSISLADKLTVTLDITANK